MTKGEVEVKQDTCSTPKHKQQIARDKAQRCARRPISTDVTLERSLGSPSVGEGGGTGGKGAPSSAAPARPRGAAAEEEVAAAPAAPAATLAAAYACGGALAAVYYLAGAAMGVALGVASMAPERRVTSAMRVR